MTAGNGVFHSTTFKVLGIGFLVLLMLIPLEQVQGLIGEREGLRREAVDNISQRWGAAQTIGGPLLVIPKYYKIEESTGWHTVNSADVVLPDRLEISGALLVEERRYGIYSTPVYTGELKLHSRFLKSDLKTLNRDDLRIQSAHADLRFPLSDVRGLRRVAAVRIDGKDIGVPLTSATIAEFSAVSVAFDLGKIEGDSFDVDIELTLAGTETLQFFPLARHTEVSLSAPWNDPSFVGAFLPTERQVKPGQFEAHWQVLDLNRRFNQHWEEPTIRLSDLNQAAFGIELYQPVGLYQQNMRAGKYGLLFIGLSFVTFFLFEVLRRWRVHPLQYLLVGLALCTFYVVLLALSEQIGFTWAYAVAAVCVVSMVSGYGSAMLGGWRSGIMLGVLLAMVYALLYGLVVSEQYSLLMGAMALLAVVALLMYLTRRVDWYAVNQNEPVMTAPGKA